MVRKLIHLKSSSGDPRVTPRSPQRLLAVRASVLGFAIGGVVACTQFLTPDPPTDYERTAAIEGASVLLGAERCDKCHGHQSRPRYHSDCESCHGPGERHVQNVIAEDGIRFPSNRDCLDCHERGRSTHLGWATSEHARAGLLCSNCHDPHNAEPWHVRTSNPLQAVILASATSTTQLCVSCHAEVGARLNLPSHHPVREGMLGCTDCHRPHESASLELGAATALCETCHASQVGPWVYEHLPVVEDCGHCHTPHGASSQALLRASQPGVCASCHTIAELGATHDPQAYATRCTDCHGAVHGSYADPHLRR
jgi:DmsE family decaheme c-type cytochrome